jgi:hypothetical protein
MRLSNYPKFLRMFIRILNQDLKNKYIKLRKEKENVKYRLPGMRGRNCA